MNTNNSQNFLSKIILRELYLNKINKKINKSINLINKLDYDLISTFSLRGGSNIQELLSNIQNFKNELTGISELRTQLSDRIKDLMSKLSADDITIESVRKQLNELTTEKTDLETKKAKLDEQIKSFDKDKNTFDEQVKQIQEETNAVIKVVRKIDISNMLTILSAISHLGKFNYQELKNIFFEYANLKFPLDDTLKDDIMDWFINYLENFPNNDDDKTKFLKLLYYGLSFNKVSTEIKDQIQDYLTQNWNKETKYDLSNHNKFQNDQDKTINIEEIKKQIKERKENKEKKEKK